MRLEQFFEKFELYAGAPDAVTKMRELVLNLAVQGRLVEQDLNDAPAEDLLTEIEIARSQTKTAKARRLELLQPVEQDDAPHKIPRGWAWCRLGTLGVIGSSCRVHQKDWTTQGVPFLRAREIVKLAKFGHVENDLFITEEHFERLAKEGLIPEPNDLMITGVGTIGVPYLVSATDRFYFKDASVLIFKNCFGLYPHYLRLVMLSPYWIREVHRESMGTTVDTLTIVRANSTPFPLPPLAEQKRIVAKVNELMVLCDRLEAQQQELETRHAVLARATLARFTDAPTPANLDALFLPSYAIKPADLRKSILALAVQGKLVRQDPNDELAEDLIARIAAIRRAKKAKQFEPVSANDAPYEVPFSWAWVRLGDISLSSDSGWSPQCLPEARSGTDWGVLKVSAVSWGAYKPEENKALPPGMMSRPDCEVKAGDFLLSRANTEELVARSVVVDQTPPRLMMSDKIVRFTFPDEIDRAFINLANTSDPSRAYYARNASGTSSSMKNVGREVMCNLPIPLPPLAEQRRIVAKVDQLMALVDELEMQLAASRSIAANLLSALVAELTAEG